MLINSTKTKVNMEKVLGIAVMTESWNRWAFVYLRSSIIKNKKLSYCWETVRRESMPRIAEMDVEMTT